MFQDILMVEEDKGRREISLENIVYSIGRSTHSDICICSNFVSRYHATLVRENLEDGSYYYRIIDGDSQGKKSSGGILVNGRKIETHNLEHEDKIVFSPAVKATYYRLSNNRTSTI